MVLDDNNISIPNKAPKIKLFDSQMKQILRTSNQKLFIMLNKEEDELKDSMITDYEGLMRLKFKVYYADENIIS